VLLLVYARDACSTAKFGQMQLCHQHIVYDSGLFVQKVLLDYPSDVIEKCLEEKALGNTISFRLEKLVHMDVEPC
jgi:hypothetical protein